MTQRRDNASQQPAPHHVEQLRMFTHRIPPAKADGREEVWLPGNIFLEKRRENREIVENGAVYHHSAVFSTQLQG